MAFFRSLASLEVMHAEMTARLTPQDRPMAILLGRYTYGTFLSSQRRGRWRTMERGVVSAARKTISAIPRFKAFVTAGQAVSEDVFGGYGGFLTLVCALLGLAVVGC